MPYSGSGWASVMQQVLTNSTNQSNAGNINGPPVGSTTPGAPLPSVGSGAPATSGAIDTANPPPVGDKKQPWIVGAKDQASNDIGNVVDVQKRKKIVIAGGVIVVGLGLYVLLLR